MLFVKNSKYFYEPKSNQEKLLKYFLTNNLLKIFDPVKKKKFQKIWNIAIKICLIFQQSFLPHFLTQKWEISVMSVNTTNKKKLYFVS